MGSLDVKLISTQKQNTTFTKCLLRDIESLDKMLNDDWFHTAKIHIGAEQELCLIDKHFKPAPYAMQLLELLNDSDFTTELAKFNIEINLDPLEFTGKCFSNLEANIDNKLHNLDRHCTSMDIDFLMTGILPTLRKFDLELDNLTPLKRYHALIKAISKLRGKYYELRIKGADELNLKHDSAMLEAGNTSFQVHLQVSPDEFVEKYNTAQTILAPILAVAANSPMLFGKRLWNETRIALFQQSVDTRITGEHLRDRSPRVTFGSRWLKNSIMDLFREDITRFRAMLMSNENVDSMAMVNSGKTPPLSALMIHNSTVYRWNRPCYGISPDGRPHLRIENRAFPSGPTVVDEVANSAFWTGLMNGFADHYPNVSKLMDFSDAGSNFLSTAFNGMHTELKWFGGHKIPVRELVLKELIPIAMEGLEKANVDKIDIDNYLNIIRERAESGQNGASWILKSYSELAKNNTGKEEIPIAITSAMKINQKIGLKIHEWPLAGNRKNRELPTNILVEEFMTTDVFTVHKDDIPELVADIMDWQGVRFIPVEDEKGQLIGLVSAKMLIRRFNKERKLGKIEEFTVGDIMMKNPVTISPESTIFDAMHLLQKHKVACLPVVKNKKLVGIISDGNFLRITGNLFSTISASYENSKDNE